MNKWINERTNGRTADEQLRAWMRESLTLRAPVLRLTISSMRRRSVEFIFEHLYLLLQTTSSGEKCRPSFHAWYRSVRLESSMKCIVEPRGDKRPATRVWEKREVINHFYKNNTSFLFCSSHEEAPRKNPYINISYRCSYLYSSGETYTFFFCHCRLNEFFHFPPPLIASPFLPEEYFSPLNIDSYQVFAAVSFRCRLSCKTKKLARERKKLLLTVFDRRNHWQIDTTMRAKFSLLEGEFKRLSGNSIV